MLCNYGNLEAVLYSLTCTVCPLERAPAVRLLMVMHTRPSLRLGTASTKRSYS